MGLWLNCAKSRRCLFVLRVDAAAYDVRVGPARLERIGATVDARLVVRVRRLREVAARLRMGDRAGGLNPPPSTARCAHD